MKDRHHNVGKKRKKTKDKQRSKKIKLNLLFIILIGCITTSDICNINCFMAIIFRFFDFLALKNFKLFDFRLWPYMITIFSEARFYYLPPLDKGLHCSKNFHFPCRCLVTMGCIRMSIKKTIWNEIKSKRRYRN